MVLKADNYAVQNNIKMHHGLSLPRETVAKQIENMRVKYCIAIHRDQRSHLPLGKEVVNSRMGESERWIHRIQRSFS